MLHRITYIFIALALLIVFAGGCNSQAATPSTPQPTTPPSNPKQVASTQTPQNVLNAPDRVDIIYFYGSNPCACMKVVGDYIQQVVTVYFDKQVDSSKLTLKMVTSDTPNNATLVKKYNSPPFWLYIVTVRGNTETVHSVPDIWGLTGDKEKLVAYLKDTIQKALEGKL